MREIGSEFWDVPLDFNECNDLFNFKYTFLSGRVALMAILQHIKKTRDVCSVALPNWCCDSMIIPFASIGLEIKYYSVLFKDGKINVFWDDVLDVDIILIMDEYFGYETTFLNNPISSDFNGIIIRDITHSVFLDFHGDADYYFGSIRKWIGVSTGGFAWKRHGDMEYEALENLDYTKLRERAKNMKNDYIMGVRKDKCFLELFNKAEEMLDNISEDNLIYTGKQSDFAQLKYLDVNFIKKRRYINAEYLINELKHVGGIEVLFPSLSNRDCPLFVPILVERHIRNDLRDYLISKGVYCPIHWPITAYHDLDLLKIYEQEISLVCDQRYTEEDMKYIIFCIKEYMATRNIQC